MGARPSAMSATRHSARGEERLFELPAIEPLLSDADDGLFVGTREHAMNDGELSRVLGFDAPGRFTDDDGPLNRLEERRFPRVAEPMARKRDARAAPRYIAASGPHAAADKLRRDVDAPFGA